MFVLIQLKFSLVGLRELWSLKETYSFSRSEWVTLRVLLHKMIYSMHIPLILSQWLQRESTIKDSTAEATIRIQSDVPHYTMCKRASVCQTGDEDEAASLTANWDKNAGAGKISDCSLNVLCNTTADATLLLPGSERGSGTRWHQEDSLGKNNNNNRREEDDDVVGGNRWRVSPYGSNTCEPHEADELVMNNLCKRPVCHTSADHPSGHVFIQTDT